MLTLANQNVLTLPGDILVCPTNTSGAMGAGLARYVRDNVPGIYYPYRKACLAGKHTLTSPLFFEQQQVLCLATKKDWRDTSTLELIEESVITFNRWLRKQTKPLTINLPLLGGGNGRYQVRENKKTIGANYSKEDALNTIVRTIRVPAHHVVYLSTA